MNPSDTREAAFLTLLLRHEPVVRGAIRAVVHRAENVDGFPSPGVIGHQHRATGRWPGKEAPWFDRDSDFVEIEIPGEHAELTVPVWLMKRNDRACSGPARIRRSRCRCRNCDHLKQFKHD